MSKYLVEIEIPKGKFCNIDNNCQMFDSEYEFCHLFNKAHLEIDRVEYYYLRCAECLALVKNESQR